MPPEMIDKNFNEKSDIYSFGCILFELIYENTPWCFDDFETLDDLYFLIKNFHPSFNVDDEMIINSDILSTFKNLSLSCWNLDSLKRPSWDDILLTLEILKESLFFLILEIFSNIDNGVGFFYKCNYNFCLGFDHFITFNLGQNKSIDFSKLFFNCKLCNQSINLLSIQYLFFKNSKLSLSVNNSLINSFKFLDLDFVYFFLIDLKLDSIPFNKIFIDF
jgi:serine/threonine protein kinase